MSNQKIDPVVISKLEANSQLVTAVVLGTILNHQRNV
jgi:hypothetical protein